MRSTWLIRATRSAAAVALLAASVAASTAAAKPAPNRGAKRSGANLFALTFGVMNVNRIFCGINNIGEICVDPTNSPVVGGGFWPKGTPDQYIFNSGLQLAGTIPSNAGFPWQGDTVGAFFMDPRGDQAEGDPITLVNNSLDPGDAAAWPNGAYVRDTAIYASVLLNRANVSQEDLWVRTWDGNPALLAGRTHPMGVLVEERGMAWNFPTGNEDIVYFVFSFTNVTAKNAAVYNNPTIDPAIRGEIAAIGADFQNRNEARFNIDIPDNGYAFTNLFAAFFADMDVGDAGLNYSTPVIPFNMGVAYKSNFLEPNWTFPADIFGPPFVASPGFIGVKYLRSPTNGAGQQIGLTIFSNTLNSGTGYPDPVGVKQLYRYLSGTSSPAAGDNPCYSQGNQLTLHFCYVAQTAADTRFFQSSGPFTLNPGESKTIVVAYLNAAPIKVDSLRPGANSDFKPGIPATGAQIAGDSTKIRQIERAMGWVTQSDGNADGVITQNEVTTVQRSLLNKALVAQAVYDNKFLLPFAPEPPSFFLIPGDNQVTIVWQKSETETVKTGGGDPFFLIASKDSVPCPGNPALTCGNALYDPNFRQYDVEGYRIYRGRTTGALQLVAQFDYGPGGVVGHMKDYTGQFAYTPDLDNDGKSECAPELGIQDDCPRTFPDTAGQTHAPDHTVSFPPANGEDHDLTGDVVQIPAGGRVALADLSVLIIGADTAVTGGHSGFPGLSNTGVSFAFVDHGVRNSFVYYYAVTAFDVNSLKSGPSSLESPRITKQVTPRASASNVTSTVVVQGVYGADNTKLNPDAPYPAIDTGKGTFTGAVPPANDGALLLGSAALEALPAGDAAAVRVDSVSGGLQNGIGNPSTIYLTLSSGATVLHTALALTEPAFDDDGSNPVLWHYSLNAPLVPYDSAEARRFHIAFTKDVRMPVTFAASAYPMIFTSGGVAVSTLRFGNGDQTGATAYLAHSRWYTGNTEPPDPTIVSAPDSAHNSGALPNVSKIWSPQDFRDANVADRFRSYSYAQTPWYPADILVTWNADSSLTVFDSTHHSPLPYAPNGGTGWGFINLAAYTAAGVTVGNIHSGDANASTLANVTYNHIYATRATCLQRGIPCIRLGQKAQYEPLDLNVDGAQDASGIALMINGEAFIMAMPAIPAAGTKWRLRAITGTMSAKCTPAIQPVMTDCGSYTFSGPSVRPSFAPGLTYKLTVTSKYTVDSTASGDLSRVHTVPDPYYVTNALEATANTKILKFVNLPSRAIVRIYSVSGVLVQVLTKNDQTGGSDLTWNLRNRNNQFVASGVYFYHVEGPDGRTKVGRFTIVNFAP